MKLRVDLHMLAVDRILSPFRVLQSQLQAEGSIDRDVEHGVDHSSRRKEVPHCQRDLVGEVARPLAHCNPLHVLQRPGVEEICLSTPLT